MLARFVPDLQIFTYGNLSQNELFSGLNFFGGHWYVCSIYHAPERGQHFVVVRHD